MSESFSYVGVKRCGCAVAACVDRPEYIHETGKAIVRFIKDGLIVERWPTEKVRRELKRCQH